MSRKIITLFAILLVGSMLLVACGGNAPANNVVEVVEEAPMEEMSSSPILDRVLANGKVVCGGRTDLVGFGYLDADGNNVGFDIDLCRAVAAALFNDPTAIEVIPLGAADRGPSLQTAEVDMLSRNVTWTSSRDTQWGNFTIVTFYDGQGFLVHAESGIETMEDMQGASVCVGSGTTTEQNLGDFFRQNGWEFEAVVFDDAGEVYGAYQEGRCDVTTSDLSQLAAKRSGFEDPSAHVILAGAISKEPLTVAVPHGDDAWFDLVKDVLYGLINAEELGVTMANVEEMKSSESINVLRLLGQEGDWGYSDLGVSAEALAQSIAAVGNYGEIYKKHIADTGIMPNRGPNELWTKGGLLYVAPAR